MCKEFNIRKDFIISAKDDNMIDIFIEITKYNASNGIII